MKYLEAQHFNSAILPPCIDTVYITGIYIGLNEILEIFILRLSHLTIVGTNHLVTAFNLSQITTGNYLRAFITILLKSYDPRPPCMQKLCFNCLTGSGKTDLINDSRFDFLP